MLLRIPIHWSIYSQVSRLQHGTSCMHGAGEDTKIMAAEHKLKAYSYKGNKDRHTMLPAAVKELLFKHLQEVKRLHDADLKNGLGRVALPNALDRKYPNAAKSWEWQWVFPATSHYTDRSTAEKRRHHLHESVLQRAF